jgi:hypothetical protein
LVLDAIVGAVFEPPSLIATVPAIAVAAGFLPRNSDRRGVERPPVIGELTEACLRGFDGGSGVDLTRFAGDLRPVLTGGVSEAVALGCSLARYSDEHAASRVYARSTTADSSWLRRRRAYGGPLEGGFEQAYG